MTGTGAPCERSGGSKYHSRCSQMRGLGVGVRARARVGVRVRVRAGWVRAK